MAGGSEGVAPPGVEEAEEGSSSTKSMIWEGRPEEELSSEDDPCEETDDCELLSLSSRSLFRLSNSSAEGRGRRGFSFFEGINPIEGRAAAIGLFLDRGIRGEEGTEEG